MRGYRKAGMGGPIRVLEDPVGEKLTKQMMDYFGDHYTPKTAKTLTETLAPGGRVAPRFNRRGTEFLTVTEGSAIINEMNVGDGDMVRIDAGEIVEISSTEGCKLVSRVFPYHPALTHTPYSPSSDAALLARLHHKKVSIVVIAQDIQYHICHAISSCLTQTYPNLQIIVVNDNSTDETGRRAEAMARFDPRIEVHQVDLGRNGSRRYGLEVGTGDFCLIIDGDDWLNCDAIEQLLTTAQNLNSELVLFGYDHYNDKTREWWDSVYPSYETKVDILLPGAGAPPKDARETAKINHTVWINFFSMKLRPTAERAMCHIDLYEDLPFSLSLMQHAKNPALCNRILHHYRRERTGQSTERWWQVLPAQKQACLRLSVEHALKQLDGPPGDYYHVILIYKINQIIAFELALPQAPEELDGWITLRNDLFALFPQELHSELTGMKRIFRQAHIEKKKKKHL